MDYVFEMLWCDEVLLQEIVNPDCKKSNVAKAYALALRSSWPTDFKKVNKAIVDRWGLNGLQYIKEMAWSGKCFDTK